jgi:hypothetical protein
VCNKESNKLTYLGKGSKFIILFSGGNTTNVVVNEFKFKIKKIPAVFVR